MPEEAARVLGIVLVVRIYHKDLGSSVRQATTATRVYIQYTVEESSCFVFDALLHERTG